MNDDYDNIEENISIYFNIVFDFITSLARIENNQHIDDLKKEYGLSGNPDINKWVVDVNNSFNKNQKEKLKFYFEKDNNPALGLTDYIYKLMLDIDELKIDTFLDNLTEINTHELLSYLLHKGYYGNKDITVELIDEWINSRNLFNIIDDNYELSIEGKWNVFKILSKPRESKKELITLLRYYYNDFYKEEAENVYQFLQNYCREKETLIKNTVIKFIDNLFANGKSSFNFSKKIEVIPIYFGEMMSITEPEENYCVIGYRYHEFVDKAFSNINSIEEQAHVFKALGDETRLKILQELLSGPKYMTELGETLEVSTPTINYHIKKFFNAGLVQIDKAENRIYYKLRKDKLQNVIKVMKENYDL